MAEEGLRKTDNDLIHIGSPIPFNEENFFEQLTIIMNVAYNDTKNRIKELIAGIVTTFHSENIFLTKLRIRHINS